MSRQKVAIVGGGIAGITAAYLLNRRFDLTLFERSHRLGGNAYTLDAPNGDAVDIAVAAFGHAGYKNFYRLLAKLQVPTAISPGAFMSFCDLDTGGGLYLTPSGSGLLAQRFAVFHPENLQSAWWLYRGLVKARRLLDSGHLKDLSVAEMLDRLSEFEGMARVVFLCSLCLLSSMPAKEILTAPAHFFLSKLKVHSDVISPRAVYSVRCVPGGTRRYVEALASPFSDRVVLQSRIRSIARTAGGVVLRFENGQEQEFDYLVLACHADQALGLLTAPSRLEQELLAPWRYLDGRVVVHNDLTAFPNRSLMQAYTFLFRQRDGVLETSVNGSLWREPGVSSTLDLVSSQHPNFAIAPQKVFFDTVLRTPVFDHAAYQTIPKLPRLNGDRRTFYCGSYFGYGLHEDAVSSALAVASLLGVEL